MKAIIFDLDGTLYRQGPVRRAMMVHLVRAHLRRPLLGLRTARVLGAYRQAQETLREHPGAETSDLAAAQVALASERTGASPEFVEACVDRWMDREPLAHLARYVRAGVVECLGAASRHGVKLAVLSDYPAESKLRAMALAHFFEVVQSAQSSAIGAFKPHPRGLEVTMARLGVAPSECLFVGDRADVDEVAATRAGVACFIVERDGDFRALQKRVLPQPVLDPA